MTTFILVIILLIAGSLLISGKLNNNQENDLANKTRTVRQSNYDQSYVAPLKRLFRNSAINIDDQTMQQLQFSLYLMYWKLTESSMSARRETNTKAELNNGLEKLMNENLSET